jgi:Domain of unknown function (DUF4034)
MRCSFRRNHLILLRWLAILGFSLAAVSCKSKEEAAPRELKSPKVNDEMNEMTNFYRETRQLYNNRKFAELETLANELRSSKARFRSGAWKIAHFYKALECRDEEPDSMWQLHEQIYKEWETKFPKSITAQVSHAQFMTDYAWHARGSGYANEVTEEGWRLFRERLAASRTILDQSKSLAPCPVWWSVRLRVALGQEEEPAAYEALFQEAKKSEPQFFPHDISRAYYLLPRWYGKVGDWEAAAADQIERDGEFGFENYARVVQKQSYFYGNIFEESEASWRKAKQGFDALVTRYPDSMEVLNAYCRTACLAADQKQAKELFLKIRDNSSTDIWRKKNNEFKQAKAWAMSEK